MNDSNESSDCSHSNIHQFSSDRSGHLQFTSMLVHNDLKALSNCSQANKSCIWFRTWRLAGTLELNMSNANESVPSSGRADSVAWQPPRTGSATASPCRLGSDQIHDCIASTIHVLDCQNQHDEGSINSKCLAGLRTSLQPPGGWTMKAQAEVHHMEAIAAGGYHSC